MYEEREKNNKKEDGFFLTQGNNPNEANTIGVTRSHKDEDEKNNMNENAGYNDAEIKEDNNNEENKEYNDEFEN